MIDCKELLKELEQDLLYARSTYEYVYIKSLIERINGKCNEILY